jgi:hypothetical protein
MVLLLVGGGMHGQSGLPAISPTSTPPAAAVPGEPAADPAATAVKTPHAATVSYSDGRLTISADNSSLNQILREISRQTGMKITGGVNDERVYGTYGPSGLALVLTALLDGTGSNMMLTAGPAGGPGELILTPRQGGPTPPNPSAPGFEDDASTDDRVQPPKPVRPFAPLMPPPVVQQPRGAVNGAVPAVSTPAGSTPAASATSSDGSVPQSPNGVKTPQQIYQQLQEMQRQKQAQQQPSNPQ